MMSNAAKKLDILATSLSSIKFYWYKIILIQQSYFQIYI